ncbi:Putative small-subunit processome, Utp11 protein [Septoria linicola]|uniref:U3 small nucleolar RNA-associated protein 11 n=1 Tax=Septoria linicola TaxID=215465 RepID=A0A9Q9EIT8_9PEZI|nr:putative small-subunit processome, Utp11 protein [Septoria linicola]USW52365.1 Putative small-subunit processome, Utp11 protein [Septoria linicola]
MSSLRNAVQRRNHRERAQPAERAKWGLLEKRKDYKLRAADHKTKTKKIKALQSKASERNEDEFYFSMVNNASKGGIRVSKRGEANNGGAAGAMDVDVVRLMKTQDAGYLRTQLQRVRNQKKRVEGEIVLGETGVDVQPGDDRIVFDDDQDEDVAVRPLGGKQTDDDVDLDMDLDGLDDDGESGDESASEDEKDLTPEQKRLRRRKRHAMEVNRKKLEALEEQEEKLSAALEGVDHQRAKMNGTAGGVNKSGMKFKVRQRKK